MVKLKIAFGSILVGATIATLFSLVTISMFGVGQSFYRAMFDILAFYGLLIGSAILFYSKWPTQEIPS